MHADANAGYTHAWVQLKWEVQAPVGSGGWGNGPADVQAESWSPSLTFNNHVGDLGIDEKSARAAPAPGSSKCIAHRRYVLRGTFAEHMELHQFPIDCQRLHIRAVLWDCPEAVHGVPLSRSVEGGPLPRRTLKFELGSCQGLTLASRHDYGIQYTTLSFNLSLRRKLSFYWWNITMPIFLLVLISFASFFMDHQALADRLNLTVVVLLTLVAFKFVLSQYIPATSYLTFMDMYVVASFTFVFLVALQNLITFIIASDGHAYLFNLWSGSALAVAWLLLHVLLPVLVIAARRDQDRRWQANRDEEQDARDPFAKDLERSPL
ncbi:Gamma-aminobutyric acid receptor subunit beta [Tetrabaena socialis]|uniref:Gamma-aminobutyric acid receptor subunit beta n=1 Tax=Tetrabaena socialis TaxID=47790 RepID=A0A2J8A6A4_9CHLO|nr:Gamma-aminobutyric acid receptor subunit beta [Tetrabaena socialis]|eukprot:PNH08027.1 Gamma-aminobutyric acid receptor subunit beta [Tetrabaena socialis]